MMGKKIRQLHVLVATYELDRLKERAGIDGIPLSEYIRRCLMEKPIPEELILLRRIKQSIIKNIANVKK